MVAFSRMRQAGKVQKHTQELGDETVKLLRLDCTCELCSYGFYTCDNCKRKQAFLSRYDGKDGE